MRLYCLSTRYKLLDVLGYRKAPSSSRLLIVIRGMYIKQLGYVMDSAWPWPVLPILDLQDYSDHAKTLTRVLFQSWAEKYAHHSSNIFQEIESC